MNKEFQEKLDEIARQFSPHVGYNEAFKSAMQAAQLKEIKEKP